jgi:hypothetical protein
VHTLSYLHKLRKTRKRVYTVTDDNVAWVLDEVSRAFSSELCHGPFSGRTSHPHQSRRTGTNMRASPCRCRVNYPDNDWAAVEPGTCRIIFRWTCVYVKSSCARTGRRDQDFETHLVVRGVKVILGTYPYLVSYYYTSCLVVEVNVYT